MKKIKGARCLDGSQYAFYYKNGTFKDKFFIFFRGGAWCGNSDFSLTLADCYQRSKTDVGSSLNYQ